MASETTIRQIRPSEADLRKLREVTGIDDVEGAILDAIKFRIRSAKPLPNPVSPAQAKAWVRSERGTISGLRSKEMAPMTAAQMKKWIRGL